MSRTRWDYVWPPIFEETFLDGDEPRAPEYHNEIIEKWLLQSPAYRAVSDEFRGELVSVLWSIDNGASRAVKKLLKGGWTIEQLRGPMPARLKGTRGRNAWNRLLDVANSIDAAEDLREAIFAGEWAEAISAALYAGNVGFAEYAHLGVAAQRALARRHKKGPRQIAIEQRLEQRNESILDEAEKIRRRNPKLKNLRIAEMITARHVDDPDYPGKHGIRKLMGNHKKLRKRGLQSQ